jgi:glycogen synthase
VVWLRHLGGVADAAGRAFQAGERAGEPRQFGHLQCRNNHGQSIQIINLDQFNLASATSSAISVDDWLRLLRQCAAAAKMLQGYAIRSLEPQIVTHLQSV